MVRGKSNTASSSEVIAKWVCSQQISTASRPTSHQRTPKLEFSNTLQDPIEFEETRDSSEYDKESGHTSMAEEETLGMSSLEEESYHVAEIVTAMGQIPDHCLYLPLYVSISSLSLYIKLFTLDLSLYFFFCKFSQVLPLMWWLEKFLF